MEFELAAPAGPRPETGGPRLSGPELAIFSELRVFCALFLLPWADLEPELALGPPALAGKVAFRPADGILAAIGAA